MREENDIHDVLPYLAIGRTTAEKIMFEGTDLLSLDGEAMLRYTSNIMAVW